jgi:hypothetical protein
VKQKFTIHTFFPNYYDETWVSYTLKSISEGMGDQSVKVQLYVESKAKQVKYKSIKSLLPRFLLTYTAKWVSSGSILNTCRTLVHYFKPKMRRGDVAYFWLSNPVDVSNELRDEGVLVVREMINCTLARKRDELNKAFAQIGEQPTHGISDEAIEEEKAQLLAADLIFCPNNFVLESVMAYGIAADKCFKTSYGWDPERFIHPKSADKSDGLNVLFVGTVDVRKGAPTMLEAWHRAGIDGKLMIAGTVDEMLSAKYQHILSRPDVQLLGHVSEIETVYPTADVFCFLSWEEGGPLVTIEAASNGLACVVTEMGGGGFVSHRNGALVVEPGDIDATVQALQTLANDRALLKSLSQQAKSLSADFTWNKVAQSRLQAIKSLLQP